MTLRSDEYRSLDATALANLVRGREITAAEALEAAWAEIDRQNPEINAVTFEDRAAGIAPSTEPDAPFYGVPTLIKDLHAPVKGLPLTQGSKALAGTVFDFDAETVARMRRAGFVLLGRSNAPEFGLNASTEPRANGPTRNPLNPAHSAGGSSGGAAAAVASGMVPIAHATDSAGSIRIPAAACGLIGLKPTRGLLASGPHRGDPNYGISHELCVSRTVRDTAAFLDAVVGPDIGAPYSTPAPDRPYRALMEEEPRRLRIGLSCRSFYDGRPADPALIEATTAVARRLEAMGHTVEEATPDFDGRALVQTVQNLLMPGLVALVDQREAQQGHPVARDALEPTTWAALDWGRRVSGAEIAVSLGRMNQTVRAIGGWFADYDLLLTPALMTPPPRLGALTTDLEDFQAFLDQMFGFAPFCVPFNTTGQPAIVLPAGRNRDNLPLSVQLAGRFGEDATLLQLARVLGPEAG